MRFDALNHRRGEQSIPHESSNQPHGRQWATSYIAPTPPREFRKTKPAELPGSLAGLVHSPRGEGAIGARALGSMLATPNSTVGKLVGVGSGHWRGQTGERHDLRRAAAH